MADDISKKLSAGMKAMDEGDFKKAYNSFKKLCADNPDNAECWYYKAECGNYASGMDGAKIKDEEIIEARTEEIAELINEAVEAMGIRITEVSEVYLTGGGISLMRGGCEFLEQCLGVKLNVKTPWMPRLNSPNYASAFAVMQMAMNTSDDGGEEKKKNGLLDKIKGFFTE